MDPHELAQEFQRAIDEEVWDQLGSRTRVDHHPWEITTAPNQAEPWTFKLEFTLRQQYPKRRRT